MNSIGTSWRKVLLFVLLPLFVNSLHARNMRDTLGTGRLIMFSENLGQWEERVLFRSQMKWTTLFVEKDCFTFVVRDAERHPWETGNGERKTGNGKRETGNGKRNGVPSARPTTENNGAHAYRIWFEGSSASRVEGLKRREGCENYFIGRDRSRWRSGVGTYISVLYSGLYDGIDMKVYSAERAMKYDFIVHPGADPSQIVMSYEGIDDIKIQKGNLVVRTSVMDIVELKPYAYQIINGKEVEVEAEFVLNGKRKKENGERRADNGEPTTEYYFVTFKLGNYDTSHALIIDPYLHFSTYTGSTADNWGTTGCYDSYKNTYTSGLVFNNGYPTSIGAYDSSYNGNADIGIFKFDTTGSQRLYATYLGGSQADMPHSMFVNSLDELVIFGTTGSANFPVTPNAYDTSFNGGTSLQYEGSSSINFPNGSDIFVCRFSSDGSQLLASTYIGGSGNDGLNYHNYFNGSTVMIGNDSLYFNYGDGARGEIITDDLNNIYVGSTTFSTDFPTTQGCVQAANKGRQEGVVFKIDCNLSNMIWSTYLGGIKDDAVYSIDCDQDYNVVVTGGTNSANFPTTPNGYTTYYHGGSADGFIAKISYYGNTLIASSYFGSPAYDQSYFVRCGKQGDVFIFGQTKASGSSLIHNAGYNTPNSGQFLARFRPNIDTLVWSTVFGDGTGVPNISPTAFAVDICNRIYLSGWGRVFLGFSWNGVNYPWNTGGTTNLAITPDAIQSVTDGQDFYIMSVDMNGSHLEYATYYGEQHDPDGNYYSGSDHVDGGTSRFDRLGTLYQSVCASCAGNDAFPVTTNSYSQHNNSSNCNNAVFRINLNDDFPVAEFNYTRGSNCTPTTITFHNTGRGDSYLWDFGDGQTSTETNPSHDYSVAGFYTVRLVAYMADGCRTSDTVERVITILSGPTIPELDTLAGCQGVPIQIGVHPELGFTYRWIQGNVSDSNIANPLAEEPGLYRLRIEWDDGCWKILDQVIEGFLDIIDTVEVTPPPCPDGYGTGLVILADTSAPPYYWRFGNEAWHNMSEGSGPFGWFTTNRLDQPIPITIRDSNGCTVTFNCVVPNTPPPTIDASVQHIPCLDTCTGAISITVTGNSEYSLLWLDDSSSAPTRSNLCAGFYLLKVTDTNGCIFFDTIQVIENFNMSVNIIDSANTCPDVCSGTATALASGGTAPYSYSWSNGEQNATATGLCEGTTLVIATDADGCTSMDSVTIGSQHSFDSIEVWADDTIIFLGHSTVLHVSEIPNGSYWWSPSTQLSSPSSSHPTATPEDTTWYYVTVTDSTGCTYSDSVRVSCISVNCGKPNIRIPNAFTPNGDGKNDRLCFSGDWVDNFHIVIFTRWGEKVYESDNINECWDGRFRDNWCMPGVYVYHCTITCADGQHSQFKGDITLIR